MSINIHHTHSCQGFLILKQLVLITSCLSVQDVKWPNLASSPFWTSYLIWQLSTLAPLFLPMRGRWACTMYRCSAFMCVQWHSQHSMLVCIVSCARCLRREGVSSTFSQVSWLWIYQFWHAHMQSIPLYIQSVCSELDWVPIFLCPLHSPHDFGFGQLSFSWCVWWHHIINFRCAMELG